jgi:hypothetical protein
MSKCEFVEVKVLLFELFPSLESCYFTQFVFSVFLIDNMPIDLKPEGEDAVSFSLSSYPVFHHYLGLNPLSSQSPTQPLILAVRQDAVSHNLHKRTT